MTKPRAGARSRISSCEAGTVNVHEVAQMLDRTSRRSDWAARAMAAAAVELEAVAEAGTLANGAAEECVANRLQEALS